MTSSPAGDHARTFHRLHQNGLLILANVWDAGSARLVESLGARALATTSAGVAWAHGYPDGDALPIPLLLATVRDIARVVDVPLSIDFEGGYAADPVAVGEAVRAVVEAGAVGINLEDGASPPDALCAKIEHAKRGALQAGVELFVNARVDVYLLGLAPEPRRVAETLARAARYRDAGADGIFAPGLVDPQEIRALVEGVRLPLNVLARPKLPPAPELAKLGVRRLSAGSAISMHSQRRVAALARAFLTDGVSSALLDDVMPYADLNALMKRD